MKQIEKLAIGQSCGIGVNGEAVCAITRISADRFEFDIPLPDCTTVFKHKKQKKARKPVREDVSEKKD